MNISAAENDSSPQENRTVLVPSVAAYVPVLMLMLRKIHQISSYEVTVPDVLLVFRLSCTMFGFLIDTFIHKISRSWHIKPNLTLFLYWTSFIPYVYFVHSFTCTFECLMFAVVLCCVSDSQYQSQQHACGSGQADLAKYMRAALKLGALTALGIFNRSNFLCFTLPAIVQWFVNHATPLMLSLAQRYHEAAHSEDLNEGSDTEDRKSDSDESMTKVAEEDEEDTTQVHQCDHLTKLKVVPPRQAVLEFAAKLVSFSFGVSAVTVLLIIFDTCYHGTVECHKSVWLNADYFLNFSTHAFIAPLRSLNHTLHFESLVNQTLHPLYTHAAIHVPMLFGPLGFLVLWYSAQCLSPGVLRNIHLVNPNYWLLLSSFCVPLLTLSMYPRQIARDLHPLLIPIVLISCIRLCSCSDRFRLRVLFLWVAWNAAMFVYSGQLYEKGLLHTVAYIQQQMVHAPKSAIYVRS